MVLNDHIGVEPIVDLARVVERVDRIEVTGGFGFDISRVPEIERDGVFLSLVSMARISPRVAPNWL